MFEANSYLFEYEKNSSKEASHSQLDEGNFVNFQQQQQSVLFINLGATEDRISINSSSHLLASFDHCYFADDDGAD